MYSVYVTIFMVLKLDGDSGGGRLSSGRRLLLLE